MAIIRTKQAHLWVRDPYDWYVEPEICSLALLSSLEIDGTIWDPAVGQGNIIRSCRTMNLNAIGTDIISRNEHCIRIHDFLGESPSWNFDHIICNPPFGKAEEFVLKAINISREQSLIAMILPLVWISGFSAKRDWLPVSPLKYLLPISPRPPMPPGAVLEAGIKPGNGTKDFAWFVWEVGYKGAATVKFLNTAVFAKRFAKIGRRTNAQSDKKWDHSFGR